MQITRPAGSLRAEVFKTLPREITASLSVGYTGHVPDHRIDAELLDYDNACEGFMGCVWHYIIRTDGTIEIGRDPRTHSPRLKNFFAQTESIHIGIVGGLDEATGQRVQTTTAAQEAALEALMQLLADHLDSPLTVHDGRERWGGGLTRDVLQDDADLDAELDAAEAMTERG